MKVIMVNTVIPLIAGFVIGWFCPYKIDQWQFWTFILLANFLFQPLIWAVVKWISN